LPRIEILGEGLTVRYEKAGVKLFTGEEIGRAKISERLAEAVDTLRSVPTLFETVAALVRSVHVIDAGDDNYDVSFSDPSIPFSIFVSVPAGSVHAGALRVAESVVHEAMHLQLTLVERLTPLVGESRGKYYSPWRGEYREARGVLHALFVFRVIDTFLMKLQEGRSPNEDYADYVHGRRRQITEQVAEIRCFQECPELTPLGTDFVGHLLN
jgi:HEXXH motif-containing protein